MKVLKCFFVDEYDIKARLIPGLVAVIPSLVFVLVSLVDDIPIHGCLSRPSWLGLLAILLIAFVFSWLSRAISIVIWENPVFKGGLYSPSTQMLLISDSHLDFQYKNQLRKTIETDSKMVLASEMQEAKDEILARRIIKDAVKTVKTKTRNSPITQQYLIDYGMTRNLLGACFAGGIVALLLAAIARMILGVWPYAIIECIIAIIYFIPCAFGKRFVRIFGERYAEKMFEDYANLSCKKL